MTTFASRADDLWRAVSAGDEYAAADIVFAALDGGMATEDVLLDLIAPVQAKVGREWAANRISVAQEHAATAINDRVIAAMAHRRDAPERPRLGRITVACIDGEWHALPARLLAEVLRLRGWQVDFLGAKVPSPHLISHLHRTGPDAVALSSSIATRLPTAHAAITACQAAGVPVLAGGAAFGTDGQYAYLLGADAWAPDARAAADLLDRGLAESKASRQHQPFDDLPHLADQEYSLVARTTTQLVRQTMAELAKQHPEAREYTGTHLESTAEDIANVVEFLATALYVDAPELFTDYIVWTTEILTARGLPVRHLVPALDVLAVQLTDFGRATGFIKLARHRLDTGLPPE